MPFFLRNFRWSINTGSNIFIGTDLIHKGLSSPLPPSLISYLHCRGIFTWDRLIKDWSSSPPIWMDVEDLMLPYYLCTVWNQVRSNLQGTAIKKSEIGGFGCLGMDPARCFITNSSQRHLLCSISKGGNSQDADVPYPLMESLLLTKDDSFLLAPFSEQELILGQSSEERMEWAESLYLLLFCWGDKLSLVLPVSSITASLVVWYDLSLSLDYPHHCFSSVQDGFFWWNEQ